MGKKKPTLRLKECRRIKHTMRKLDSKIRVTVSGKKLYLRNGQFLEGTVATVEGTVGIFK